MWVVIYIFFCWKTKSVVGCGCKCHTENRITGSERRELQQEQNGSPNGCNWLRVTVWGLSSLWPHRYSWSAIAAALPAFVCKFILFSSALTYFTFKPVCHFFVVLWKCRGLRICLVTHYRCHATATKLKEREFNSFFSRAEKCHRDPSQTYRWILICV